MFVECLSFNDSLRFPADCPIRQIVTLSRTDGSQGVPAYGAVLPPAFRPGHSVCQSPLLYQLSYRFNNSRDFIPFLPAILDRQTPSTCEGSERYTENVVFPEAGPVDQRFPADFCVPCHNSFVCFLRICGIQGSSFQSLLKMADQTGSVAASLLSAPSTRNTAMSPSRGNRFALVDRNSFS